ncbi:MAG: hypothetical protein WC391_00695 [Methanoregula sp.]|jgi:hypothetical protein
MKALRLPDSASTGKDRPRRMQAGNMPVINEITKENCGSLCVFMEFSLKNIL